MWETQDAVNSYTELSDFWRAHTNTATHSYNIFRHKMHKSFVEIQKLHLSSTGCSTASPVPCLIHSSLLWPYSRWGRRATGWISHPVLSLSHKGNCGGYEHCDQSSCLASSRMNKSSDLFAVTSSLTIHMRYTLIVSELCYGRTHTALVRLPAEQPQYCWELTLVELQAVWKKKENAAVLRPLHSQQSQFPFDSNTRTWTQLISDEIQRFELVNGVSGGGRTSEHQHQTCGKSPTRPVGLTVTGNELQLTHQVWHHKRVVQKTGKSSQFLSLPEKQMINICFATDVYKCLTNPVMPLVFSGLTPASFCTITNTAPINNFRSFHTNLQCVTAVEINSKVVFLVLHNSK